MRPSLLGVQQKIATLATIALALAFASACRSSSDESHVEATYDKTTGKLSQLTVNAAKDGKPNIISYMNGTEILRIEIDADEDGKTDRWEYYGRDRKLERVGLSRANDGKQDAWAYQGPDGTVARVEVSTKRDGKPNRTEFYERASLVRAQEDTDSDGHIDKWEEYEAGALVTVSFDTRNSGTPTTTINYRK